MSAVSRRASNLEKMKEKKNHRHKNFAAAAIKLNRLRNKAAWNRTRRVWPDGSQLNRK
ncbi:hypothetical protein AVEN_216315-1, partial [Araneus ventricosus]